MDVVRLVLTSDRSPLPTGEDAQRIQEALSVPALRDLGIEHVRVRVGEGHIDVTLFLRRTANGGTIDGRALVAAIRELPSLRAWNVTLPGDAKNGYDVARRTK